MEKIKSQGEWLNIIKTGACNSCHGARHAGHADDLAGARPVPVLDRGLDAAPDVRQRADVHDPRHHAPRYAAGARHVRRLDRPHRRRRACRSTSRRGRKASSATWWSACGTGAAPPPICTTRSPPTAATRGVNANGKIYGSPEDSTDVIPVLDPVTHTASDAAASGARPEHAVVQGQRDGAVAVLGRRADLGQQDAQPQPDARREGPRVVHAAHPPGGQSGLLQAGLLASRRPRSLPLETGGRNLSYLRSGDRQVHADRHLLPHPSPQLRLGCQPDAVDQRRRRSARA